MPTLLFVALTVAGAGAACPGLGDPPVDHPPITGPRRLASRNHRKLLESIDFAAVKRDLMAMMTKSDDAWPADYNHYGPFFIRLSWHNAGSYRSWDGRGGADGGRQRFDPERSWADNTNLDKARTLLAPIKMKYGAGLSWGDLFVLAGTAAIESMGGPTLGFCGGRIDDDDGEASLPLGAAGGTPEQEALAPCPVDGECPAPLGQKVLGLIYVNPEGPHGNPDPKLSAPNVRATFGRMHMNDTETVALIGGGHAFGKTHGACPDGPGPSPAEDEANPWPGKCGSGKGSDAFTSGFEGPWTTTPTAWDNSYFQLLVNNEWEKAKGPGGHWQWHVKDGETPNAPAPFDDAKYAGGKQPVMMLTSDISLKNDPKYWEIVQAFAADQAKLDHAFKHAWYKLMSRDMGPHTRCVGSLTPPAQPFQMPLPSPPSGGFDVAAVSADLAKAIAEKPIHATLFTRLALACATTFRTTDYVGGCNGGTIRFAAEHALPRNAPLHLTKSVSALEPIKARHGDSLPWADLIVLAGHVALVESAGATALVLPPFCAGRSDAPSSSVETLKPAHKAWGFESGTALKEARALLGLSVRELVALNGASHMLAMPAAGDVDVKCAKGENHGLCAKTSLDAVYFQKFFGGWSYGHDHDRDALLKEPSFKDAVQAFAATDGQEAFFEALASAWAKLAVADRFDGPLGSQCEAAPAAPAALGAMQMEAPAMRMGTFPTVLSFVGWLSLFSVGMLVGGRIMKSHLVGLVDFRPVRLEEDGQSCS